MSHTPSEKIEYPESEKGLLEQLEKLFTEWEECIKEQPQFRDYTSKDMVWDGFYPYYTMQPV